MQGNVWCCIYPASLLTNLNFSQFLQMICKNFQHLLPDACPPQTSKDDRSQCCISPLSTWKVPSGYFLVISFEVKFGGRSDLVFSVQETAGIFTTNLSTTTFVLYLTIEGIFCCQNNYAFCFFFSFFAHYFQCAFWKIICHRYGYQQFLLANSKKRIICVVPIGSSLRMITSTIPRDANKENYTLNFDCLWSQRLQKRSPSLFQR